MVTVAKCQLKEGKERRQDISAQKNLEGKFLQVGLEY